MSLLQTRFLAALEGIRHGRLTVTTPEGHRHSFGSDGPEAAIRITDWALLPAIAWRGDVGFGESHVAGHWDSPDLEGLLALLLRNESHLGAQARQGWLSGLALRLTDWRRGNSITGAARNIRAHYDVGNEFYQLWLDPGMSYSSALFQGTDDLETAQRCKNDRILSRLGPGERGKVGHVFEFGAVAGSQ